MHPRVGSAGQVRAHAVDGGRHSDVRKPCDMAECKVAAGVKVMCDMAVKMAGMTLLRDEIKVEFDCRQANSGPVFISHDHCWWLSCQARDGIVLAQRITQLCLPFFLLLSLCGGSRAATMAYKD